jgi:hypothetical protein
MLLASRRFNLIYLVVIQTILLILSLILRTISVNYLYHSIISIITCGFFFKKIKKEGLVPSIADNKLGEMNM